MMLMFALVDLWSWELGEGKFWAFDVHRISN